MKPLIHHGYNKLERIVAIEYHPVGPNRALLPHSVFTMDNDQPSKAGWIASLYDFDWCERDQSLYYHCSGGGGRFYLHRLSKPTARPRCAVWWDASLVAPTNGAICSQRKLSHSTVRRMGYDILTEPVPLLGGSANPFLEASQDSTEFCIKCHDYLPTENLCQHVWWCERCGGYSVPQSRCEHRRRL